MVRLALGSSLWHTCAVSPFLTASREQMYSGFFSPFDVTGPRAACLGRASGDWGVRDWTAPGCARLPASPRPHRVLYALKYDPPGWGHGTADGSASVRPEQWVHARPVKRRRPPTTRRVHAANFSPPTVSDTKSKFLDLYGEHIPAMYNTVIQELLVQQHFMRHNIRYSYDAVRPSFRCACLGHACLLQRSR